MALPQIISYPAPLRGNPQLNKKLQNTGKLIKRASTYKLKRAKRYVSQTIKKQYLLSTAFKDLKCATKQNEDVTIAAIALSFIIAYACSVIGAEFTLAFFSRIYAMSVVSGFDILLLLLFIALPSVVLICALLAATSANFMSLAFMDGANRKIYRSIRSTLARSLGAASRITGAWFLLSVVHFARLMSVVIPLGLYFKFSATLDVIPNYVPIAVGCVGAIWICAGLLKFSMVPYVALFEPQYLLHETFARSRQIINRQALVFMITGITLLSASLMALYELGGYLQELLGFGINLVFIMSLFIGLVIANGSMVMLYRKRKLARR